MHQRQWTARQNIRRLRNRIVRRALHAHRARRTSDSDYRPEIVSMWSGDGIKKAICTERPRPAPSIICFSENPTETLQFMSYIQDKLALPKDVVHRTSNSWLKRARKRRKLPQIRGYLDFSRIDHISTSASVVLAANYDRASRLAGRVPPTVNLETWSDPAFTTLYELGFFSIVGHVRQTDERYRDSISGEFRTMAMISGTNSNELRSACESIMQLSYFIGDSHPLRPDVMKALNSALGEALSNVTQHAYPGTYETTHAKVDRWWVSASADRSARTLRVVVYDQGASIPWTLPNRSWASKLDPRKLPLLVPRPGQEKNPFDADYIKFAIGEGTSQTYEEHRGQGLPQMRDLVRICGAGSLTILSRAGMCCYTPDEGLMSSALPLPIEGTLIEWEMCLPRDA